MSTANLKIAGGNILARGVIDSGNISATVRAQNLQLEKLPSSGLPSGMLEAALNITGDMSRPRAEFSTSSDMRNQRSSLSDGCERQLARQFFFGYS